MDGEEILLQKCKDLIQTKLGWEGSDTWTNHDFQMLSERILAQTGINLSVATLKRIWGKVKYDSKPTITTLNTLAAYLGYENWRAFKQVHLSPPHADLQATPHELPQGTVQTATTRKRRWRSGLVGTVLCGGILVIFIYAFKKESPSARLPAQFSFSSKKVVSSGVPNSVIFDYDATAAEVDSVFIQQSWDPRLRTQVSRNDHQHTSIYYTPGFFQAKLVVGNEIVKEHNLWVTTDGWLALVRQQPVPVYFNNEDFEKPGMLSLPVKKLVESDISFQPEPPWTSYYNVREFGDIKTNDFVFETEVRSDYKDGAGVCQFANLTLLIEGTVIIIPLSIKGCVSDLSLIMEEQVFDGKKTDLSAFGCDLSDWVKVRFEATNNKARIFVDERLAFEGEFKSTKRIVGLLYRFQGSGSIRKVLLAKNSGEKVFEDDFR